VNLAKMLTGQAAHDAAVGAGVITGAEDLPNDFFIQSTDSVWGPLHLADAAAISMISSTDVTQNLQIDAEEPADLYDGAYRGSDVYGVVPGQPIVMNLSIRGGLVTELSAVP
jgi:hypothetical protein